jgi:FtsP/CotA-like multicopper oxidase with cupredoxin domain
MLRRRFVQMLGGGACLSLVRGMDLQKASAEIPLGPIRSIDTEISKPDVTLRIAAVDLEIAPGKIIKTTGYNGSVPGPFLRFREGQQVTVEVINETKEPEIVHWHGLFLPPEMDGAEEEGTPPIPPGHSQRYTFVPRPAGTRWYHTHVHAGRDLKRGTYSGQFGMVYIEPGHEAGQYDAEFSLCLHGWQPYLDSAGGDGSLDAVYQSFSINSRALGHGDPLRVRQGQRVLFRILNASATLRHQLALAGHAFTVIALDGNPVATPRAVDVLSLGPAERVDAMVTMDKPGVWILGEVDEQMRSKGLGVVVEYENRSDAPQWLAPASNAWDYTVFGSSASRPTPAETISLVFRQKFAGHNWVDHWTINNKEFPKTDPILVRANSRYRLRFDNQSDEDHPVHLHRHTFELTQVAGKPTSGVFKDVVVVPRRNTVEVDLVADQPGLSLFHCHQQMHMDFGFMTLLRYLE